MRETKGDIAPGTRQLNNFMSELKENWGRGMVCVNYTGEADPTLVAPRVAKLSGYGGCWWGGWDYAEQQGNHWPKQVDDGRYTNQTTSVIHCNNLRQNKTDLRVGIISFSSMEWCFPNNLLCGRHVWPSTIQTVIAQVLQHPIRSGYFSK